MNSYHHASLLAKHEDLNYILKTFRLISVILLNQIINCLQCKTYLMTILLAQRQKINAIDMKPLLWKLRRTHWQLTDSELLMIETEYRRFLILCQKYPDAKLSPTRNMDKIWHEHILDTKNYFKDCESIFGKYLHHRPYFGPYSGDTVWNEMDTSHDLLYELYLAEFGEKPKEDCEIFIEIGMKRSYCSEDCDKTCYQG